MVLLVDGWGDTMRSRVDLVLFFSIFGSAQCSSILTRSMIKMPQNSSSSRESESPSQKLESLMSHTDDKDYQIIYPYKSQESGFKGRSLNSNPQDVDLSTAKTPTGYVDSNNTELVKTSFNSSLAEGQLHEDELKNHNANLDKKEDKTEEKLEKLNSKDISRQYWNLYKPFSSEFFNKSLHLQDQDIEPPVERNQQGSTLWEVLQKMFRCVWSAGPVDCIQETLKETVFSETTLQFLVPRLPRLQSDRLLETYPKSEELDSQLNDLSKGRKKFSRKLQTLLTILMLGKMIMLPALATMALVSGKAFLMSLLSLGVALVAASIRPHALSVDKRQEIAPQPPLHSDHAPNGYYYVM